MPNLRALPTENASYLERLLMRWPCSIRLQLKVRAARAREASIAARARGAQLARIRLVLVTADINTLCQVERLLAAIERTPTPGDPMDHPYPPHFSEEAIQMVETLRAAGKHDQANRLISSSEAGLPKSFMDVEPQMRCMAPKVTHPAPSGAFRKETHEPF